MLKLLAGLLAPEAGSAYGAGRWYGEDGEDAPEAAWRAAGYMPQQPTLLDRTVIENVALGQPVTPELRAAVLDVARRLGLWRFLERLPEGLDSPAGKNGSRLSGGQRQLVWFLRIASRLTMSSGRCPALSARATSRARSGVKRVRTMSLIIAAGAWSHIPMQGVWSSEKAWSCEVWPSLMPSSSSNTDTISANPAYRSTISSQRRIVTCPFRSRERKE